VVTDRRAIFGLLGLGLAGCSLITDSFLTNEFSGDEFPIDIETESGAIIVGVRQAGAADRVAVVDLLSPFTLTDPGPEQSPSVSYVDLTLLGMTGDGAVLDLAAAVPRARFLDKQVIALHPCPDRKFDGSLNDECVVGPDDPDDMAAPKPRVFQSIIGADALAGDAVRMNLGDNRMFILPDIGGSDRGRSESCDAVFNSPYRGGGTLVIAGTEVPFGNRRITLQACLGPDPDPAPAPASSTPTQRGSNALLVVSTSIGITILGEAAYERYRLVDPSALALDALAAGAAYLPSGLVAGRLATINRLTLVASSSSNPLSPCRQIYAHQYFFGGNCTAQSLECPCKDDTFCSVPAMLALDPGPAGIAVLVVSDTDPTLQALRTELRPDQPEVDGVLGIDVLRTVEIDVDYPHDRLVARCVRGGCVARPQFAEDNDDERGRLTGCIKSQPTGPIPAR
jgi:hypothetical protein